MKNLKRLRGLKGITQKELSVATNIPRTRLVYFESDECHCLSEAIEKKLCSFYKVNIFELYGIDILKYVPSSKEELQYVIGILEEAKSKWD